MTPDELSETEPEVEPSPEELAALEAAFEREFGAGLAAAHGEAIEAMEPVRLDVLARVRQSIDDEAASARSRARRRALRILFYVVNLVALTLVLMIYVGTRTAIRLKAQEEQRVAARTELVVLTRALARHYGQKPGLALPQDFAAFLAEVRRQNGAAPLEGVFGPSRLQGETCLDLFGRPYRLVTRRSQVLVYSVGPNGRDEEGGGDDIFDHWVQFVR